MYLIIKSLGKVQIFVGKQILLLSFFICLDKINFIKMMASTSPDHCWYLEKVGVTELPHYILQNIKVYYFINIM